MQLTRQHRWLLYHVKRTRIKSDGLQYLSSLVCWGAHHQGLTLCKAFWRCKLWTSHTFTQHWITPRSRVCSVFEISYHLPNIAWISKNSYATLDFIFNHQTVSLVLWTTMEEILWRTNQSSNHIPLSPKYNTCLLMKDSFEFYIFTFMCFYCAIFDGLSVFRKWENTRE